MWAQPCALPCGEALMAMHEQILRKEQDPFHKPEGQLETEAEQAAAAGHRRVDAEEQRAAQTERTSLELMAPSVVAHLPGQTAASDEAVKHLFTHFTERENKEGLPAEAAQRVTATQTDPRTTARAREPRGKWYREVGEEFKEGFAADFMPDSQIAGPSIDEGPRGASDAAAVDADADAWEGAGSPRRRKRGTAARGPAKKSSKREGKG